MFIHCAKHIVLDVVLKLGGPTLKLTHGICVYFSVKYVAYINRWGIVYYNGKPRRPPGLYQLSYAVSTG